MGITATALVDAPLDEVFDWHSRPGALTRLMPPWQPVRVERESGSLADGQAVLTLPGGLRWVAQHDPAAFDPPHRFVDELANQPLRSLIRWRHTHEFAPDGNGTRLTDTVETQVPERLLRPMFAYRQAQLSGDLAAHRWAAARGQQALTIAVTGSSGLVGQALVPFLTSGGHRVIRLVRRPAEADDERRWQPDAPDPKLLDGVDALVHLAGASIAGRFTEEHKRRVRNSRVEPTRRLAELAARTQLPSFVSASAIGIYGADRGDETLTEDSRRGDGFLADVVDDWEQATQPAAAAGTRVVHVRTGIVQSPRGGVLRLQLPLFVAGLGGRLGSGQQWLAWIGIDDLVDVYHRALVDDELRGPVNATAPNPVRNADFTRTLARVLHRPAVLPVPSIGPRLLLGTDGARETAEASQRVLPARLETAGHRFRHPELEPALRHLLGRTD